jgi:hypothetical protein
MEQTMNRVWQVCVQTWQLVAGLVATSMPWWIPLIQDLSWAGGHVTQIGGGVITIYSLCRIVSSVRRQRRHEDRQ